MNLETTTKLTTYTYQAGKKEGMHIDSKAIEIFIKMLGYNSDDNRWSNHHDVLIENLSDTIIAVREFANREIR